MHWGSFILGALFVIIVPTVVLLCMLVYDRLHYGTWVADERRK